MINTQELGIGNVFVAIASFSKLNRHSSSQRTVDDGNAIQRYYYLDGYVQKNHSTSLTRLFWHTETF